LRQHMLAVEAALRAYATKLGEDPEAWGLVGLLHDFDYERYPNETHSPTEGHPSWGVRLLRERGLPEASCRAILGHASYTGAPPDGDAFAPAIDRATGARPIGGNELQHHPDSLRALDAMLDLIERAVRWVHFENYIIRDDRTGRRFADALATRARAGVRVRVL